jgi:anti-sigma regulatory factor (Ser/Thr protein kinase)
MWVLPSDVTAVVHARRYVVGVCEDMSTEKVDMARLLVTELVSNAVRHGSGTVVLAVAREGGGVRVEVYDESPDMPVLLEPQSSLMEHGAGLRLVAALASSWGVASRDGHPGKRVWFALL